MTKLCPRGKAAAKRKFKVYPSAYANAYASKICAGKIKDPSGTKRKDWGPKKARKGLMLEKENKKDAPAKPTPSPQPPTPQKPVKPFKIIKKKKQVDPREGLEFKKGRPPKGTSNHLNNPVVVREAKVGMAVTAGSQSAMGRLEKSGMKKMMSGGFGIFSKKKKEEAKSEQEEKYLKKKKRLEELRKEIGAKKGKMMIMIAIGKPKKANKGAIMNVANKLEKASKAHAGQAKTLKSLKLSRGGGAAIRGTNFKGVF